MLALCAAAWLAADVTPPVRPEVPRHLTHIRLAFLAYNGWQPGDFERKLLRERVDLVVPHPRYLPLIRNVAPRTPQLIYANTSNVYLDSLTDWLAFADANGADREEAFYHVTRPTPFRGMSASSRPVAWFWNVARQSESRWSDLTVTSSKPTGRGFSLGTAGETLVLGYPERFREVRVDLAQPAGAGWTAILEYPITGGTWKPLVVVDGTDGWHRSGSITFDPPGDWVPTVVNKSPPLYHVRIRPLTAGQTPTARTLLGRDSTYADAQGAGTIYPFDAAADIDQDGYLTDAEYAGRRAGHHARFIYESRLFYPYYGPQRFVTRPGGAAFRRWAATSIAKLLAANPLADGVFLDNTGGKPPLDGASVHEPATAYAAENAELLVEVGKAIAPKWILANTAGQSAAADPVLKAVPASMEEFAIRPLAHNHTQFEDLAAVVARRQRLLSPPPLLILDSLPTNGDPLDPRTQLATLAYYYLLANPETTFLMCYGGHEPASAWKRHGPEAVTVDVGKPTDAWKLFAVGSDPADSALTYKVFGRAYTKALVLYKPLSYARGKPSGQLTDNTATPIELPGRFQPLRADGTLAEVVTRVTLRNGEGAILMRE